MIEATLALYYWDGEQWVKETTSLVDVNTNTIMAAPDHFGQWAVLGEAYKLNYLPIINK
jgi:hypothetical protein